MTPERLRELLRYDPVTGIFTRRLSGRGYPRVGSQVGCKNGRGYLCAMLDGKIYLMHRVAWLYVYGELPDQIDHINGEKSDNRICNLRPATPQGNNANKPLTKANTTGFKGVSWSERTGKFRAGIKVNGKSRTLGYRETAEEAHALYVAEAKKHFGEFARAA